MVSGKLLELLETQAGATLVMTLRGPLDRRFVRLAGRGLAKLLRRSTARVVLSVEELREDQYENVARLLQRLSRYGDRVLVHLGERVRGLLSVDSSVSHLVLDDDLRVPA